MRKLMTFPNYALEGRMLETAAIAGVRPECLETDLLERIRAGDVTEANIADKLAEWKATDGHHFFSATGASLNAEAVAAFGEARTLTAQAAYVRKHGEQQAHDMAEKFGTTLGSTRPGKTPQGFTPEKPKADAVQVPASIGKNPWSAEGWSITKQGSVVKALGETKAASIAKAAGSFIGATRPARAA